MRGNDGNDVTGTDAGRTGDVSGLIQIYDKHKRASEVPLAMDWIKAAYANAIEYTGMPKSLRGGLFARGVFILIAGAICSYIGVSLMLWDDWFERLAGFVFFAGTVAFVVYMVAFTWRLDIFGPEDAPTLFDRKNRKIYRIARAADTSFKGIFKPWPMVSCEYDWDLAACEHHASINIAGATTANRTHTLKFVIRQSVDDPTVVDGFQLGNGLVLNDSLADGVWEHIRRFMEEDGPALPPGQGLADRTPPQGWWQSLGAVGPFGPNYFKWWRDSFGIMLINHVTLPVSLPLNLLWGTGNWLSYKTARPVVWSPEVQRAVGPVLRHG